MRKCNGIRMASCGWRKDHRKFFSVSHNKERQDLSPLAALRESVLNIAKCFMSGHSLMSLVCVCSRQHICHLKALNIRGKDPTGNLSYYERWSRRMVSGILNLAHQVIEAHYLTPFSSRLARNSVFERLLWRTEAPAPTRSFRQFNEALVLASYNSRQVSTQLVSH